MNISTPRNADWHAYARAADNTEVVISRSRLASNGKHVISSISASFDTTASSQLDLYGLSKVGYIDCTDDDVVDLTANTITIAGHGLTNGDKVVFHTNGGTAPTNLTSGNTYFVVGVSGADFQLALTSGGAAIDLAGTQANLATESVVLPLSKSWQVYDQINIEYASPLLAVENSPLILKLGAVSSVQGILNVSGYSA